MTLGELQREITSIARSAPAYIDDNYRDAVESARHICVIFLTDHPEIKTKGECNEPEKNHRL